MWVTPASPAVAEAVVRSLIGPCDGPVERHGHVENNRGHGGSFPGEWVFACVIYNRMVVGGLSDEAVDRLFHALADATRRDILHRCVRGEPSVSRLADVYPMSFAAVQKHVAVLERAGLVTKERRGREQLVRTDGDAVGGARRILDELEAAWRGRAERMSDLLARRPQPRKTNSEEDSTG
jgi:DNA-binding transcriptional ArsR family regulator